MAQAIGSKQTAGLSIYVQRWQRWQSDIEKNAVLEVEKIKWRYSPTPHIVIFTNINLEYRQTFY